MTISFTRPYFTNSEAANIGLNPDHINISSLFILRIILQMLSNSLIIFTISFSHAPDLKKKKGAENFCFL